MSVRVVTPLDAIAWLRLVEMKGEIRWAPRTAMWMCCAPDGGVGQFADCESMIYEFSDSPGEAIILVHQAWVELGRPRWPVEIDIVIGDDEPGATASQRRPDEVAT